MENEVKDEEYVRVEWGENARTYWDPMFVSLPSWFACINQHDNAEEYAQLRKCLDMAYEFRVEVYPESVYELPADTLKLAWMMNGGGWLE